MNYNVLATTYSEKSGAIHLAPFCEVYDNKNINSDYKFWFNRPEVVSKNSHGLFPYSPDTDIKETLQYDESRIIWSILISSINKHIGNVSLQRIDLINRSAEIAIVIGEPEYYGKGVASFAVKEICEHGFKKLGLNRIWSGTAATNIGMQKVFERLGFKKEGVFKEAMFLDGKFIDVYEYGLLKEQKDHSFIFADSSKKTIHLKQDVLFIPEKQGDQELINKIEEIRGKNNKRWMDLVRLAFDSVPDRAKDIMKDIVDYDKQIQEASSKLANSDKISMPKNYTGN